MGADSKPSDSHIVKMMEALKDSLQGIKTEAGKLEAMVRDLQSMLREKADCFRTHGYDTTGICKR